MSVAHEFARLHPHVKRTITMISNRLHLQIGLRSLTSPVVISTLVPPDQVCLSIPTAVGPNSRSVCLSIACRPLLSVAMGEFCEIR